MDGLSIKEAENHIYTPIGLDIGSETPEEIALSIAAEILSLRKRISKRCLKSKKIKVYS
ncbi:XdhC family protein [Virgibacillus halophilus]|uniref:XdhC family protein n=2 Tax=Tigheibacillus halophilus TaxID=361280 RepID=A0ABU5C3B4_9BACI|nr:XdhC family protein [Virgibacillus halophilus]